jgi:choline kinase
MRAVILSAGQGKRLSPLTDSAPKCAIAVNDRPLLQWQIEQLVRCGVNDISVVVGFGAEKVDQLLGDIQGPARVKTVFNPFFEVADNLISCWVARGEMHEDFLLLNGDTLFEPSIVRRLFDSARRPVTLARDHKAHYDEDDMKVHLDGDRLVGIGKDLPADSVDGESIGMLLFRADGPARFRKALEDAIRSPAALRQWYLSVIGQMALNGHVWTESIEGCEWAEVDYPLDLIRAAKIVAGWPKSKLAPSQASLGSVAG